MKRFPKYEWHEYSPQFMASLRDWIPDEQYQRLLKEKGEWRRVDDREVGHDLSAYIEDRLKEIEKYEVSDNQE